MHGSAYSNPAYLLAMAEEMHNFYEEEDLYMYMEGSTPSLDQASYSGEDEDEKLVLVMKDNLEHKLEASEVKKCIELP